MNEAQQEAQRINQELESLQRQRVERAYSAVVKSDAFIVNGECLTPEMLIELAHAVDGATGEIWDIGEYDEVGLFDLIVGAYWACADAHEGQTSGAYEALSALSDVYTPGAGETGPEPDSGEEMAYEQILAEL